MRDVTDDTCTRAIAVLDAIFDEYAGTPHARSEECVDALIAAGLLGPSILDRLAAGRSPVDVLAGLLLLDRFRNSRTGWDVDNATWAVQQAQRDYAAALAVASEQTDG